MPVHKKRKTEKKRVDKITSDKISLLKSRLNLKVTGMFEKFSNICGFLYSTKDSTQKFYKSYKSYNCRIYLFSETIFERCCNSTEANIQVN